MKSFDIGFQIENAQKSLPNKQILKHFKENLTVHIGTTAVVYNTVNKHSFYAHFLNVSFIYAPILI